MIEYDTCNSSTLAETRVKRGKKAGSIPPFSMPLTAASETTRSAALSASLVPSTTDLETKGEVENTRARVNGKIRLGAALRRDMVLGGLNNGIKVELMKSVESVFRTQ